jgi:hypothetical protein
VAYGSFSDGSGSAGRRGLWLEALLEELLDAHADTLRLGRHLVGQSEWLAHLAYLEDLERVARRGTRQNWKNRNAPRCESPTPVVASTHGPYEPHSARRAPARSMVLVKPHRVTVEFDDFGWTTLAEEGTRQGVTVEELLVHAAMYYLSDLESGWAAVKILPSAELTGKEEAARGESRRFPRRPRAPEADE